jgi:serine/threonine-protein kinase
MTPLRPHLQPGHRCGEYEIGSFLAAGDQAEIYSALSPAEELCAIKFLPTDAGLADKVLERFLQQGVALTHISHPGVVGYRGAGVVADGVWIALELVAGETLRTHFDRERQRGGVELVKLLDWVQQACDGMAESNRKGVVHRNLAPEHILIVDGKVAKVIGFGSAKLGGLGLVTTQAQQIGTAWYGAAEQHGGAPAHESMDVYATGVILYEGIARVRPMGPLCSMMAVVTWHIEKEAPPLHTFVPGVPADLEALIHRALAKDPAQRPTMRQLTDGLRDVLARLRAPERRVLRNASVPGRGADQGPTQPMPIQGGPVGAPPIVVVVKAPPPRAAPVATKAPQPPAAAVSARGGTVIMTAAAGPPSTERSGVPSAVPPTVRTGTAPDRAAMVPAPVTPTPVTPAPATPAPVTPAPVTMPAPAMPAATAPRESTPADLRATDIPVESAVRPSLLTPRRRAPRAALAVGLVTLAAAAAGWMVFTRGPGPASAPAAAPGPAAPEAPTVASPPPPAPPAPTLTASASAAPAPPAKTTPPAKPQARPTPAPPPALRPAPGKNRPFDPQR